MTLRLARVRRSSKASASWAGKGLCFFALGVWILGDGGSAALSVPGTLATGRPPLPHRQSHEQLNRLLSRGNSRRVVVAAADLFAKDPSDARVATLLVRGARRSGRLDWLEAFSLAANRRAPTAAARYLLAEVRFAQQGYGAGLDAIEVAHKSNPGSPSIGVSYASALAATGRPLEAYGVIGRWSTDPATLSRLDELSLRRLTTMTVAIAPAGLGGELLAKWLASSWLLSDGAMHARGLVLASSILDSSGESVRGGVLARQAVSLAARAGDATSAAVSVINAAGLSAKGPEIVSRSDAVCQGLPRSDPAARADCLLSALEGASLRGDLGLAMSNFAQLRALAMPNPLLDVRLGVSAVPMLRMVGEHRLAAEIASRASSAARGLGRRRLAATFLVTLSGIRRTIGDHFAAYDAAVRARELLGMPADPLFQQATAEAARAALARGDDQAAAELLDRLPGFTQHPLLWSRERLHLASTSILLNAVASESRLEPGRQVAAPQSVLALALEARRLEEDGDLARSLVRYGDAIESFDRLRINAGSNVTRTVLLNEVWQDVTRRAVRLALASGEARLAIGLLEHARARSTLNAGDLSWTGRLAPGTTVVAFVVAGSDVFAVVINGEAITPIRLPTEMEALRSRVAAWRSLAQSNAEGPIWSAMTDELGEVLFGRIEEEGLLDRTKTLYVVPDDSLHLLSFAGLLSARELDYRVAQAASLSDLQNTLSRPPSRGPIVAFGAAGGSDTVEEMRAVGPGPGSKLLGPRATEAAWRRRVAGASVIHFGGHSVAQSGPRAAGLQLRGDSEFDGTLTVAEILAMPIGGATVVLLACDTATRSEDTDAAGYYRQTPSIGEAFITAGARSVVGNLWPITEEDARILAEAFYGAGGPARGVGALEEARTQLRRRWPDLPRRWAGAVWLGAATPDDRLID